MARVLVVDDDRFMRGSLVDALEGADHEAVACEGAEAALARLAGESFDVAITDLKMPGMGGLEFVARARELDPRLPVVVITAHGTVETAVQAMKRGAFDYILKPFGEQELTLLVAKALEHRRLVGENEALRGELRRGGRERPLLGESAAIRAVRERIAAVADSGATVLIHGETGTGKELVAREIHYSSPRAERPFITVNCAALSAGLLESELFGHEKGAFTGADRRRAGRFELAEGGTLLLDEVSEIEPNLQAKLLRVLQEREFERVGSEKTIRCDVRVLATTNRDLEIEVREGRFREDLYFRLAIVPIEIPPLRERKEDISALARAFQARSERNTGRPARTLGEATLRRLSAYHWPGNVRELENLIERAVLLSTGSELEIEGIGVGTPARHVSEADVEALRGLSLEDVERLHIEDTLKQFGGHQRRTAESLGIGVRTLRDKIKRWGLRVGRGEAVTS
jgi:two-component system response regulator AtoC